LLYESRKEKLKRYKAVEMFMLGKLRLEFRRDAKAAGDDGFGKIIKAMKT